MTTKNTIHPPSRSELLSIRIMVFLGLLSMGFFLYTFYQAGHAQHSILFWLLLFTIAFTCIRIIVEWVHYIHITVPPTPPLEKEFTVDIFTTYCPGEPIAMIEETLKAITQIRYPHKGFLCDEANDPYLRELCKNLGIHHVTRTNRKDAKAGNINNALKQSSGELCVVLDPDHVPSPEFLDPIVPHFNDPSIGFVQIVQAYKNSRSSLIAKGAAQQTYQFYGPMMMTMNKYGTVPAIGANCTFRRSALDSIGGHAAGLAEDMNTAMHLHARGWRSVYVPMVLARGLVPSTLSAYYKQQLKWSRGVFELLFTTYLRLFRRLTWRQKLHYGLGALYYFSGVVFLINFLIPILFLLDLSTASIGLESFMISVFPLMIAIVLIRHYVQTWVMDFKERGFHVVGGLLMIGTWWIHALGFVFAVIRKKVPYDPTPKDNDKSSDWSINIPNMVIIILSAFAIIYGLYRDWNPYTIGMAGFALLNCLIMLFTIAISRQESFRSFKSKHRSVQLMMKYVERFKFHFWKLRHRVYKELRTAALPLLVIAIGMTLYIPNRNTTSAAIATVHSYPPPDIVSLYLPWGNRQECQVPMAALDSIYQKGSFPMIIWEPWQSLFDGEEKSRNKEEEKKIFQRIVQGDYDRFLEKFCKELRTLGRPVFLKFAAEADYPFCPWSQAGDNTASEFKAGWKYVHDFFDSRNVFNAIWVWSPWKPAAVDDYFPGAAYVDWLDVTIFNNGSKNPDSVWETLRRQYEPFHKKDLFQSGLPVMITEIGSSTSRDRRLTSYPEIKGLALFNTQPPSSDNPESPSGLPGADTDAALALSSLPQYTAFSSQHANTGQLFKGLRGIGYSRGQNWYGNRRAFRWDELIKDCKKIRQLGITSIKHYGPGIYDHNILRAAAKTDLTIQYGFWIPSTTSFDTNDAAALVQLHKQIIAAVRDLKQYAQITSWNIGNTTYQNLGSIYYKPFAFSQRYAYLRWLKDLVEDIQKEDPSRPVTIDIAATSSMPEAVEMIHAQVPRIAGFGLIVNEKDTAISLIQRLRAPWFYGNVTATCYQHLPASAAGVYISNWKDDEAADMATLDGLLDSHDRRKPDYYILAKRWAGSPATDPFPEIKILRPAFATERGARLTYNAIIPSGKGWRIASHEATDLKFEWYLVHKDVLGTPIHIIYAGAGSQVTFTIPPDPSQYELYLYAVNGMNIKVVHSSLNTPLTLKAP